MPEPSQPRPADRVNNEDAINCWDQAAEEFASFFADGGDLYHKYIINPCLMELLGDITGKTVLDLACGEGHFARHLVEVTRGSVQVVGVDASETMIRIATERSQAFQDCLTFRQGDAGDLKAIGPHTFDVAVCNMALMDIKNYRQAISEIARVLKPRGAFLFSILHPCFFTPGSGWLLDDDGSIVGWQVDNYHTNLAWKWTVKRVMTEQTYSFHRTLEDYVSALRENGFAITDMREPVASAQLIEEHPRWVRELRRGSFLVVRCVLLEDMRQPCGGPNAV